MSSTLLASNNAVSTLASGITSVATTAVLAAGTGSLFPQPSGSQYFALTFTSAANLLVNEIVHVTNVTGDVITMVRAQEGTTARAFLASDLAQGLVTAGTMQAALDVPYVVATGGPNAWAASQPNSQNPYGDGQLLAVNFSATNTSAGPNLNVGSAGARTIYESDGVTPLPIGWLPAFALLMYSASANGGAGGYIAQGLNSGQSKQNANLIYAGPASGSAALANFRAMVSADMVVATNSVIGALKPDGVTCTVTAGVLTTVTSGGTVTSVALSLPGIFNVTGSPITTNGTLTAALATQAKNLVWSGPATGSNAAPTFRALVAADLPLGSGSAVGAVSVDSTTVVASGGGQLSVPTATNTTLGLVKPDNTSITITAGVLTAVPAAAPPQWTIPTGGTPWAVNLGSFQNGNLAIVVSSTTLTADTTLNITSSGSIGIVNSYELTIRHTGTAHTLTVNLLAGPEFYLTNDTSPSTSLSVTAGQSYIFKAIDGGGANWPTSVIAFVRVAGP